MENVESHFFARLNETNDAQNCPKKCTWLQPCWREYRFRTSVIRAFSIVCRKDIVVRFTGTIFNQTEGKLEHMAFGVFSSRRGHEETCKIAKFSNTPVPYKVHRTNGTRRMEFPDKKTRRSRKFRVPKSSCPSGVAYFKRNGVFLEDLFSNFRAKQNKPRRPFHSDSDLRSIDLGKCELCDCFYRRPVSYGKNTI